MCDLVDASKLLPLRIATVRSIWIHVGSSVLGPLRVKLGCIILVYSTTGRTHARREWLTAVATVTAMTTSTVATGITMSMSVVVTAIVAIAIAAASIVVAVSKLPVWALFVSLIIFLDSLQELLAHFSCLLDHFRIRSTVVVISILNRNRLHVTYET